MKITLSKPQLDKLSDITIGLGQLFFGSLVIPYIIPNIDKPPLILLIMGLFLTLGLWILAIRLVKK